MSNYVEWKDDPRREKSIYDDDIYEPSANEPKSRGDVIEKRWAFCPVSGQLLILDAPKGVARSEKVEFSRPLSDLDDTMFVVTRTDMVDYHRRYALDPLIKTKQQLQFIEILKNRVRATVEEACPECKHPQMEYYTMQLRSADEGQTVFYECRNCRHSYSTNN